MLISSGSHLPPSISWFWWLVVPALLLLLILISGCTA